MPTIGHSPPDQSACTSRSKRKAIDTYTGTRYAHQAVIKSIRHRGLRRAHERGDFRKVHTAHQTRIATVLSDLEVAAKVSDLDLPTYILHPLKVSWRASGAFASPATGGSSSGSSKATRTTCTWSTITRGKEREHMSMDYPTHPGISIREGCLAGELTVTEAARILGVARHTLSRVLNGHAGISPEMAIRLEKVGWSNAEFWLRRQTAYDLAQARLREDQITVGTPQPRVPVSS